MATDLSLPVLSGARLFAGDRAEVAALRAAAERHGFFYLADHGVDPALIAAVFAQSARFFALPDAEKQAVHLRRVAHALGWEPLRAQTLEQGSMSGPMSRPMIRRFWRGGLVSGPTSGRRTCLHFARR